MLTNVFEIDTATYARVLAHNIKTGGNLLAFGQAGTGKTEMAIQEVEAAGFEAQYINISVLEAPDLIGLPVINDQMVVDYASPKMLPLKTSTSKPVVLILDELDKGKPEMQNPLLELLQSHSINGRKLAIQAVIATGNLPDEGAHSQPVSHALTNRCKVFKLTSSFEPWADWANMANINPLVIGFLSKHRELLSQPPIAGDPTAYARCSPRSWTQAARDLDTTSSSDTVDFQTLLVAGRVGMSAAVEFRVWLDHYRHLEPLIDRLVKDGTFPNSDSLTLDRLMVCAIGSVAALARECRAEIKDPATRDLVEKKKEVVNRTAKFVFKWLGTITPEFKVAAVKTALTMADVQANELTKIPEVMATYLEIRKSLKLGDRVREMPTDNGETPNMDLSIICIRCKRNKANYFVQIASSWPVPFCDRCWVFIHNFGYPRFSIPEKLDEYICREIHRE